MTHMQHDRLRRLMIVLACVFNLVAVAATNKPVVLLLEQTILGLTLSFDTSYFSDDYYGAAFNNGLWLAPTVAVLLLRKYLLAAFAYALVLLSVLIGRIYFDLPSSWTGERFNPKGDGAMWAQTFVGMGSILVIAFLAIIQATILLQRFALWREAGAPTKSKK